jgi:hypothetical protein
MFILTNSILLTISGHETTRPLGIGKEYTWKLNTINGVDWFEAFDLDVDVYWRKGTTAHEHTFHASHTKNLNP